MTGKTPSRKYAGQSESQRIQERRERFLEAGLEIFGTVGLRGAKIRPLCKQAGLTERYFYESFSNVEDLFCAVYQWQNNSIQTHLAKELPKLSEEIHQRTHKALDIFFTIMHNPRLVRILLLESMIGSEKVQAMHQQTIRNSAKVATQFIRMDNPEISLPDEILETVAMAINGAVNTLVAQWMLEGYRTPQETIVTSATMAVKGIMAEIRNHQ